MTVIQFWTQTGALVLAIVGALIYQTHYIDKRIDDLKDYIDAKMETLEAKFNGKLDTLKVRLDGIDNRLEKIDDKLEIPALHKP